MKIIFFGTPNFAANNLKALMPDITFFSKKLNAFSSADLTSKNSLPCWVVALDTLLTMLKKPILGKAGQP